MQGERSYEGTCATVPTVCGRPGASVCLLEHTVSGGGDNPHDSSTSCGMCCCHMEETPGLHLRCLLCSIRCQYFLPIGSFLTMARRRLNLSGCRISNRSIFDPATRCFRVGGGCLVSGNEWAFIGPHNMGLRLISRLFGPPPRSYAGRRVSQRHCGCGRSQSDFVKRHDWRACGRAAVLLADAPGGGFRSCGDDSRGIVPAAVSCGVLVRT
jgi:hypothetical protein